MSTYSLFATTPKAMESILFEELQSLEAEQLRQTLAGVSFQGDLAMAYRACLWSRTANRILLVLSSFSVHSANDLYNAVQAIDWYEHINPEDSIAVSFSAKNSEVIDNSHFGALKVKDAIVDQFRARFNVRPSIDTEQPNLRINVHLHGEQAQLSIDLSGESLHRRGYRDSSHPAPIKENLAAAILWRSNWLTIAESGGTLLDPMCGSGTLLLEGAMMAADYAPGLLREYFGFIGWKKHDAALWQTLRQEAEQRKTLGLKKLPVIVGFDVDKYALSWASKHIATAGLSDKIHLERRDIEDSKPASSWQQGLVVCNPPYGERLGDDAQTSELYKKLGATLQSQFVGWQASMIISNPELGFRLGIRSRKPVTLFNGALECKLLRLKIEENAFFIPKVQTTNEHIEQISSTEVSELQTQGAEMFANRLQKNLKKLARWAKQQGVSCYRVYDADLPEYCVAVDLYQGEQTWVNVQEYEPPKTIDAEKANQRLAALLAEIPRVLNIPKEQVFLKIRRRQRSTEQYEKVAETKHFHQISEGGCQLLVNFEDYLDTGLFLDHRPIRTLIQKQAKDKRFLNLFAYTGSATVHAAVGGAKLTTSVDMSNTYLQWAKNNLALNPNTGEHEFIQANCLEWLAQESAQTQPRQYDLIFLDPPTFSNSKRMDSVFDIQKDYVLLLEQAMRLLAPKGILYFSTNFRRFRLDEQALALFTITDMSAASIPQDFARHLKIHYCWSITHAA
ncbi:MAG: bifunctional 23S rRNA (guanine(2069)-N(7))-methyltransferase RlmK/23S rRNA (guanine(2445)-N(2))-methyltransferase RlmL [Methylococcaceae bacterium]